MIPTKPQMISPVIKIINHVKQSIWTNDKQASILFATILANSVQQQHSLFIKKKLHMLNM